MNTYDEIRLVTPSDPANITWVRWARQTHDRFRTRGRDSFAQAYSSELLRMEEALRFMVSEMSAGIEERILHYRRVAANGSRGRPVCREIDYVIGRPEEPRLFVEFKTRERTAETKGLAQCRKSLRIARQRWPEVRGFVVSAYMGRVFDLSGPEPVFSDESRLGAVVDSPPEEPELLWIDGEEAIERAMRKGVLPSGYLANLIRTRKEWIDPCSILPNEDDDFGSVSRAFPD